jgi:putative oxidoreductase
MTFGGSLAMKKLVRWIGMGTRGLDYLGALFDLVIRWYLAKVFWQSGFLKVTSWDATVALFTNVYHVFLLPPELAAVLGAAVELGGSALLLLGLSGRLAAAALFGLNIISVISYPEISDLGLKDHFYWGVLLLFFVLHGTGKLSVDYWIRRRLLDNQP